MGPQRRFGCWRVWGAVRCYTGCGGQGSSSQGGALGSDCLQQASFGRAAHEVRCGQVSLWLGQMWVAYVAAGPARVPLDLSVG